MILALLIAGALALLLLAVALTAAVEAYETEQVPHALQPLWARLKQLVAELEAALERVIEAARIEEAERTSPQAPLTHLLAIPFNPDGSPMPLAFATQWAQPAAPKLKPEPIEPERDPTFLLLEIETYCNFEPAVAETTVQVSRRDYRRLVDYCALAFDEVLTPEATFDRAGLELVVKKAR